MVAGETILETRRGNCLHGNNVMEEECHGDVTVGGWGVTVGGWGVTVVDITVRKIGVMDGTMVVIVEG